MRIGLIVNPLAGIGGRVGLKGSDGAQVQQQALRLGAVPEAQLRTGLALNVLRPLQEAFELVTAPGPMGEDIARQAGFEPLVVGKLGPGPTQAEDTRRTARQMQALPVDLLLFAGGDGTARDIYEAVGGKPVGVPLPVLGIPAGVKIHSGVFATHPRDAGQIASVFLLGRAASAFRHGGAASSLQHGGAASSLQHGVRLRESEVVDLDEQAYRLGSVSTRLYGYLNVPYLAGLVQNRKAPTPASEAVRLQAIAAQVVEGMLPGWQYILGPGTTTRAIAERLNFPKTLVGVDVYTKNRVVDLDVGESRLLELLEAGPAKIVVTPTGGQGFIFGRGNQPISPQVIRKVGRENIAILCTIEKLNALRGAPLLVDTGDPQVDEMLAGHLPVVVGYREQVVYRVAS